MILVKDDGIIREAMPQDAPLLCAWRKDSQGAPGGFPQGMGSGEADIRQSLEGIGSAGRGLHIMEWKGKPIGEISLEDLGGGRAKIGVEIRDAFAQNQGLDIEFLALFIDGLLTYGGYKKIILAANGSNLRARHVYGEKLGFRPVGAGERPGQDVAHDALEKESWSHAGWAKPYLRLRLETPADYREVELLIHAAFWKNTDRGARVDEHLLAHKLRQVPAFVPQLDYVAEREGRILGSVLYSKAKIISPQGQQKEVLTFGPLAVLPQAQCQGVGKALMRFTIGQAKRLGYQAIVLCGDPDYYPRLGFRRAAEFGLSYGDRGAFDPFMAMELRKGALGPAGGRYYEDEVFHTLTQEELAAFHRDFSALPSWPMVPVERLLARLAPEAARAIQGLHLSCLGQLVPRSQREIAALPGIDAQALEIIRSLMAEHGRIWGEGRHT